MKILHVTSGDTDTADKLAALLSVVSGRSWTIIATGAADPADTLAMIRQANDLPAQIDVGAYDELWLTDVPGFGLEWSLILEEGHRPWVVMALDSVRWTNTTEMFIHRVEAQLTQAFGSWNTAYRAQQPNPRIVHDWDRFSANATHFPEIGSVAGCGNAHSGPNASREANGWDYDWGDPSGPHPLQPYPAVLSSADRWARYPKPGIPNRLMDRTTWGVGAGGEFKEPGHRWWLEHLPKNRGYHYWQGRVIFHDWWRWICNAN